MKRKVLAPLPPLYDDYDEVVSDEMVLKHILDKISSMYPSMNYIDEIDFFVRRATEIYGKNPGPKLGIYYHQIIKVANSLMEKIKNKHAFSRKNKKRSKRTRKRYKK